MSKSEIESVKTLVAKAIYKAERAEGHCDDQDTFASYLPAAKAAIDAYHDYIRQQS